MVVFVEPTGHSMFASSFLVWVQPLMTPGFPGRKNLLSRS
jgi:hypothetical protein